VLPALVLNYAGQIGNFLDAPDLAANPFFKLAPNWSIYPLVALATLATIIASQAIITGAFSMTRQAMQLGYFPGVRINQTSAEEHGQIYVPFVNWTMMAFTVGLTVGFGSSDRLAGAYGTAVSTTMVFNDGVALPCHAPSVALVPLPSSHYHEYLVGNRSRLLLGEPSEDIGWRLDPADIRRPRVHHHDDLALRR